MVKIIPLGYDSNRVGKTNTYPNSLAESEKVRKAMQTPDWEYFRLTDERPTRAFAEYLKLNELPNEDQAMNRIVMDTYPLIIAIKKYHNRPRPHQVNPNIDEVYSSTAQTPSYPAGHTLQSLLIADMLGNKYPERRRDFEKIADRIAEARVSVGLHYPSDNEYSNRLAQEFSNIQ